MNAYITLLRPRHWLKNLMLFFPPFFGGVLLAPATIRQGFWPFVAFCLGASAVYVCNDLLDADRDARHPDKQNRPLPAGLITKSRAAALGCSLAAAGLGTAATISWQFALFLLAYQLLMTAYSLWLKQVAVLDVFCIATGFLIRLEAGGIVFGIPVSRWLFLTVFLLALFLAIGKRLAEQRGLAAQAEQHRPILARYPPGFLEGGMFMTGAAVLVTYSIYVIDTQYLVYTVPLCCFALLKYLYRVWLGQNGNPVDTLIHDPVILLCSLLWLAAIVMSIYA